MKFILILTLLFSGYAHAGSFEKQCNEIIHLKNKISEDKRLIKLFTDHWKYLTKEFPEMATYLGYSEGNDRWSDSSFTAIEQHEKDDRCVLDALKTFDRTTLSSSQLLNYDLYFLNYKEQVEGQKFNSKYLQLDQLGGIHSGAPQILQVMAQQKVSDYKDRLSRLNSLPIVVDQAIELLKEGVKNKITPPKSTLTEVPKQIRNVLETDWNKNPFYESFKDIPSSIVTEDREILQAEAKTVIREKVFPAFKKFLEYVEKSYIPNCREDIAWTTLPNGKAWYEHLIRAYTTTNLTAEQIHELGLKEVARIKEEMEKVKGQTKYSGSLKDFFTFLKTDSKFHYDKAEDLLAGYRDIAKRIDPELPRFFGKLPRMPYGVKPIPSYSDESQPSAYYMGGSTESGRAGYFMANTYNLKSRLKWEMEALTLHEAVPGHHLQIALAKEMTGVPEFRKNNGYTAYSEGWGLYAESLGEDLGMYKDPYSKFGQLTFEMWRAIRLVVDTGMHAKGWSREKALQFFQDNAGKANHDIKVEVDRYIVWAGQALAYKIGQLKIKELRELSKKDLGDRFDIRMFHDQVLEAGPLPLSILENKIKNWVATEKKKKVSKKR